jgi:rod shape-determining protein MreD
MGAVLAFPVMVLLVMLQTVVFSRLPLLHGTVDIVLLMLVAWALQERVRMAWLWSLVGGLLVSFISAIPLFTPVILYLIITILIRLLQKRVWQSPVMEMLIATAMGTILYQTGSMIAIRLTGSPLPVSTSLSMVVLPSTLLNLILAIPVYAMVSDLANWLYPQEIEE